MPHHAGLVCPLLTSCSPAPAARTRRTWWGLPATCVTWKSNIEHDDVALRSASTEHALRDPRLAPPAVCRGRPWGWLCSSSGGSDGHPGFSPGVTSSPQLGRRQDRAAHPGVPGESVMLRPRVLHLNACRPAWGRPSAHYALPGPPGGCQQCGRRWSAGRLPAFWSQLARRGQVTQPVWPTVLIMHGDRGEWRRWPARLSDGAQHVASAGQGCRAPRGPRLCPEPFSSPCQKRKVASP